MLRFPYLVVLARLTVEANADSSSWDVPSMAQVIDQTIFNALPEVLPTTELNVTSLFFPPETTLDSLFENPFHVYDEEFLSILGENPTLTLIAEEPQGYEIFHEAVVWFPPTDEVFFVQNSGALSQVPGFNTSSGVYKVSLSEVENAVASAERNVSGSVTIHQVEPEDRIHNPNGGANYKDKIVFATKGEGEKVTPSLVVMSPHEPYDHHMLVNNFFGRQFTSLNDIIVHPVNHDIYFSDTLSAWLQGFRPAPGLRPQVYRFNEKTGALTVVADGFTIPNGIVFSPKGDKVYVVDSGAHYGPDWEFSNPATIYSFDVTNEGTFANRKVFAYTHSGTPDGIHVDAIGNVWAGCGDGVHVWNPSGKFIGKIYLGETCAQFSFAGNGRMLITAEANLYYATLAAEGGSYMEV